MHHIMPKGLSYYANGPSKHPLIDDKLFEIEFKNTGKVFFLYGDTGATNLKPRISCMKLGNSYHLASGIGELEGDTIFVENKEVGKVLIDENYPFAIIKFTSENFDFNKVYYTETAEIKIVKPEWIN